MQPTNNEAKYNVVHYCPSERPVMKGARCRARNGAKSLGSFFSEGERSMWPRNSPSCMGNQDLLYLRLCPFCVCRRQGNPPAHDEDDEENDTSRDSLPVHTPTCVKRALWFTERGVERAPKTSTRSVVKRTRYARPHYQQQSCALQRCGRRYSWPRRGGGELIVDPACHV